MLMAQRLEKKKTLKQYRYPNSRGNKVTNISIRGASKTPWIDNYQMMTLPKKTSGTKSKVPFRKLSDAKLQTKCEKGFCYRCDQKFSLEHHCRLKELQTMVYQGEEELLESNKEDHKAHELDQELVELSMNLMVRLPSPKTIKLKNEVRGKEVVALIDPRATHNFISRTLVKQLEMSLDETKGYGVFLGKGESIKGDGVCQGVQFLLQGVKIVEDFPPVDWVVVI